MVKQRERYVLTRDPVAIERLKNDQCPGCGLPKADWKRRTDWRCCSKECGNKFYSAITSLNWQSLREKVLERDNYCCVKCGKQETELQRLGNKVENWVKEHSKHYLNVRLMTAEDAEKLKGMWVYVAPKSITEGIGKDFVCDKRNDSLLTADHIMPIALGGNEWEMENIQTLCQSCNKVKTRKDMKAIADLRFVEKKYVEGQKSLTILPQEMVALFQ